MRFYKPIFFLIGLSIIFNFISTPCYPISKQQALKLGHELAWKVYNRYTGEDSCANMQMILINSQGNKRVRTMKLWTLNEGKKRFTLIRFYSPADIAGTAFLDESEGNGQDIQHLYLPALGRARRISGRLKTHRFVNSDFTYEDLERHYPDNYVNIILGIGKYKGQKCWKLESIPKPNIYSQYSKYISWITPYLLPVKIDYYGKNGKLIKTYRAIKWGKTQNIWTIYDGVMKDLVAKHSTELIINKIRYNIGLDKTIFSVNRMGMF